MLDKQLDYFKCKDKAINDIQMNMVEGFISLTKVMNMVFIDSKG
jgi:hypothetical protein